MHALHAPTGRILAPGGDGCHPERHRDSRYAALHQDMSPSAGACSTATYRTLSAGLSRASQFGDRPLCAGARHGSPWSIRGSACGPDLVVEETIVPVEGQSLLVGILRDITERERNRAELDLSVPMVAVPSDPEPDARRPRSPSCSATPPPDQVMFDKLARLVEEGKAT